MTLPHNSVDYGLNPCCIGICYRSSAKMSIKQEVLILVVLGFVTGSWRNISADNQVLILVVLGFVTGCSHPDFYREQVLILVVLGFVTGGRWRSDGIWWS